MRRVLAVLLSVAFVASVAASPVVRCVRDGMSWGNANEHDCCGEQAVSAAPAGTCCVISQPVGQRTFVKGLTVSPEDRHAVVMVADHAGRMQTTDHGRHERHASPPTAHLGAVPIYLQQLSLLI